MPNRGRIFCILPNTRSTDLSKLKLKWVQHDRTEVFSEKTSISQKIFICFSKNLNSRMTTPHFHFIILTNFRPQNHRPSSVARGGKWCYSPPPLAVLESMQNSTFLAVLRLTFALKTKIAPPSNEIGVREGEDREMMITSRSGCQCT